MIKNGWTEKIEKLQAENQAMKEAIRLLFLHGARSVNHHDDLARLAAFLEGIPK